MLTDELQKIKIMPVEVIVLEPQVQKYYDHAMESGDEAAYVPAFELFTTEVAHGPANQRVKTPAIGLQCKTENINLIRELFTRLFNLPPDIAYLQYTPSGLLSIIGENNYQHMITENNKYLTSITTIPIEGIDDDTLELTVLPPTAKNPTDQVSIRNIFLSNIWCLQVEPTQTPGRILLVTTKGQITAARQWIDENLAPLFTEYLTRNSAYAPNKETPIPHRMDVIKQTSAMQTYAQSLIRKYHVSPYNPNQTPDKKYTKPPTSTKRPPKITYDEQQFPLLPNQKTTEQQNTPSQATTGPNATPVSNTNDALEYSETPKIDLEAIQKDIKRSLREDFQLLITKEIEPLRQEFHTSNTELRQQYDQMAKKKKKKTRFFSIISLSRNY